MRYRVMKPHKHKKSSNPWYRRVVPADLRGIVGKTEIKQSLGTISHAEAVAEIAKRDAHWTAEFARLRRERIVDDERLAVEYCDAFFAHIRAKGVDRADRAILLMLRALADAMVSAWGRRSVIDHGGESLISYAFDNSGSLEEEDDDLVPEEDRALLVARLRIASTDSSTFGAAFRDVIAYAAKQKRWEWFVFPIGMVEDAANVSIRVNTPLYGRVAAEMARRLIDYRSPRWDEQLLRSLGFLAAADHDKESGALPPPVPAVELSDLVALAVLPAGHDKLLSDAFANWQRLAALGEVPLSRQQDVGFALSISWRPSSGSHIKAHDYCISGLVG
jgi:hypothetical protein